MSSAAQTLVAAGGSVAIAVAYGTGSQFHALAIVGISFMGAVACAVHASAREAADEARWWSLQCRRFELDRRQVASVGRRACDGCHVNNVGRTIGWRACALARSASRRSVAHPGADPRSCHPGARRRAREVRR